MPDEYVGLTKLASMIADDVCDGLVGEEAVSCKRNIVGSFNDIKGSIPVVDALVLGVRRGAKGIVSVLLQRRVGEDRFTIPGGPMGPNDEGIGDTAIREFVEDTGIEITDEDLDRTQAVFDLPERYPNARVVSHLYVVNLSKDVRADTNKEGTRWVDFDRARSNVMGHDHYEVLDSISGKKIIRLRKLPIEIEVEEKFKGITPPPSIEKMRHFMKTVEGLERRLTEKEREMLGITDGE